MTFTGAHGTPDGDDETRDERDSEESPETDAIADAGDGPADHSGPATEVGDGPVDSAAALLESVQDLPLAEHPDLYQRVHAGLQGALAGIDDA